MTPTQLFMAVFAAVLGGGLLAASCVWGFAKYSRLEAEGRQKSPDGTTALIAILMPLGFLFLTLWATFR